MHQIIYVLVRSKDNSQSAALYQAKSALDTIVHERSNGFDYYTTFDNKDSTVSGKARYGEKPTVTSLDSEEGSEMFEEAKQNQWQHFQDAMDTLRKHVNEDSDYQIYGDSMSLFWINEIGEKRYVKLFTELGDKLSNDSKINTYLEGCNDEDVYIIPADVHY